MNSKIIDTLKSLASSIQDVIDYDTINNPNESVITTNKFRLKSIKNAIVSLSKLDFKIHSVNDVEGIKGIGKGIKERITEILDTNTLSEIQKNIEYVSDNADVEASNELKQIYGISNATATKLIKKGIKSIDDLRKAIQEERYIPSRKILLGLKYLDRHVINIPHDKITAYVDRLYKIANEMDPNLEVHICGSYRRGKQTSNDVDVLLFDRNFKTKKQIDSSELSSPIRKFVAALIDDKFVADIIDLDYITKCMLYCKYNRKMVFRMDIRFVPYNSKPTALLYFTGPQSLNIKMRDIAKSQGLFLNEYGLFKDTGEKLIRIKNITTEKDVFNKLGIPYLTPTERERIDTGKMKK